MSLIILDSGGTTKGQGISTSLTGQSKWVYMNSEGKLTYKKTDRGDRIMDFSHAGYMGGGVTIPEVPVRITLYPSGSDDTENIQAAISKVAAMPLKGEFRGAVLLAPGNYNISSAITISVSGVVIRGSGSGIGSEVKSTINLTGKPFNAITLRRTDANDKASWYPEPAGRPCSAEAAIRRRCRQADKSCNQLREILISKQVRLQYL